VKVRLLDSALLLAGFLLVWELTSRLAGTDVVSSPVQTIGRTAALLDSRNFWIDAASTGSAFFYACVIAIAGGLLVGLTLGLSRFASEVADPILGTVYSVPKITLYPIILLIFGLSPTAKIAFGVIHGFFPVAIFAMNAVRNVAPVHRRTAKALRLKPAATIMTVLAPAAIPEILAGIRIAVAVTLLGVLIAEFFASSSGIGYALIRATELHNVPVIFALTLLLFIFAVAINALLQSAEDWIRRRA
jgi:NitT/TauT family transport system permease protein